LVFDCVAGDSGGEASPVHYPAENAVKVLSVVENQFDLADPAVDQGDRKKVFLNALLCQGCSGAAFLIHKFYFALACSQLFEKITGVINIIDLHTDSSSRWVKICFIFYGSSIMLSKFSKDALLYFADTPLVYFGAVYIL